MQHAMMQFEHSNYPMPKHLKLCVSFVVLQCLARLRLGWHQLQIRNIRIKKARACMPRNQRLCRPLYVVSYAPRCVLATRIHRRSSVLGLGGAGNVGAI
jgi:hypothetical protein